MANNANNTAPATDETMSKKDFQSVQLAAVQRTGGTQLALRNFAEMEKFSHFMAMSNFMPKHLRGKQADCLAVLMQAQRWEMDPFAVAQKTYFVNEGMAYEAQLVNAIINSRAPLKGRLRLEWSGEGDELKCKAIGTFAGEDTPHEFEAELKTITTRNSPLWKQQPKQQLGYFASRAWARLYCPEILMGVYTKDEMEDSSLHYGADNAKNITPNPEAESVINNIADGIKAEKKQGKKAAPPVIDHDPETGEVIEPSDAAEKRDIKEQVAAENKAAAQSEAPEDGGSLPDFDINTWPLNTGAQAKLAAEALIKALEPFPESERGGMFAACGGQTVYDALHKHGEGMMKGRIKRLGIHPVEPKE